MTHKKCTHDPRLLKGKPIGMYHCPICGMMVIAGMEHPELTPEDEGILWWNQPWFREENG